VVVDNASTDGGAELLVERAAANPAMRLVQMGRNAGYATAVNAAFAVAGSGDVLLLNPDVELSEPEPVHELRAVLAEHPRIGVAAPRLVGEDGAVQTSARRFPSLGALLGTLPRIGALAPLGRSRARYEEPSQAEHAVLVDWVVGAAMLIRRRAFEAVGGWDERYFLYCEDVDFCRRCARAGWETAYVPEVRLLHRFHRESAPGAGRSLARRRHYASHARLFAGNPRLLFGRGRGADRPLDAQSPR
jgi:GT2 family glycosyltransferase